MQFEVTPEELGQVKVIIQELKEAVDTLSRASTSQVNTSSTPPSDAPKAVLNLNQEVAQFLGLEDFKDVKMTEEEFGSNFQKQLYSYHLHKFIKQDRFTIHDQKNYYDNGDPGKGERWSKLVLSKEEMYEIPWEIVFFIEDKDNGYKFVLACDFETYWRKNKYTLYAAKTNNDKMKQFYEDFKKEYRETNIFRNKTISFVATMDGAMPQIMEPAEIDEDSVFISDNNWEEIETNVIKPFTHRAEYEKNGIPLKRGIICSGPPGCGKTITLKTIMKTLNHQATIINVTPKSISSPSSLGSIFDFARDLAPAILIFEDIDVLGESRSNGNFSAYVGEMLAQLDGLSKTENLIVIATTNYPDRLDSALSNRPSRFDRHLKFDVPTDDLKLKILERELREYEKDPTLKINEHAKSLKDMSGAMLKEVAISTVLAAMKSKQGESLVINNEHMQQGINKVRDNFPSGGQGGLGFH